MDCICNSSPGLNLLFRIHPQRICVSVLTGRDDATLRYDQGTSDTCSLAVVLFHCRNWNMILISTITAKWSHGNAMLEQYISHSGRLEGTRVTIHYSGVPRLTCTIVCDLRLRMIGWEKCSQSRAIFSWDKRWITTGEHNYLVKKVQRKVGVGCYLVYIAPLTYFQDCIYNLPRWQVIFMPVSMDFLIPLDALPR